MLAQLTPGYLWRDRDGAAFLTPAEAVILARSYRPLASKGADVVQLDPGEGEAEGEALAALMRAGMVERGQLTIRGRDVADAVRARVPAEPAAAWPVFAPSR
jgi:hypothetical protein